MSILTDTHAGLKGWQWIAVIGAGGGLLIYLRSRNAAASSSGTSTDPVPASSPNGNPITTIIEQQGAPSTSTGTTTTGTTKVSTALPKVNAGSYAQRLPGVPNASLIKIGHIDANGKYSGKNVSGGVPVYSYSSGGKTFSQGFTGSQDKNHDIYIPAQFKAYIVG